MQNIAARFSGRSDDQLQEEISRLVHQERELKGEILLLLVEVEQRQLHLASGYSSLFTYCTGKLGYSESAANRRIRSARTLQKFPELFPLFQAGQVTLSSISLIAGDLTQENASSLIPQICGKSQREVEKLLSTFREAPQVRDQIRPVGVNVPKPAERSTTLSPSPAGLLFEDDNNQDSQQPPADMGPSLEQETIFKMQFGVKQQFLEKLKQVQELLSNRLAGDVSFEAVFTIVMDDFIGRNDPSQRAARREKRKKNPPPISSSSREQPIPIKPKNHLPKKVRDEVFTRDQGQCSFVAPDGTRCGARRYLQIDHIQPRALGGNNTPENLRLLCQQHNLFEAISILGPDTMARYGVLRKTGGT